jgi:hypothetical protein
VRGLAVTLAQNVGGGGNPDASKFKLEMPNPTGCIEVSCLTTVRHSVIACLYVRLLLIIYITKTKKNQGGCGRKFV